LGTWRVTPSLGPDQQHRTDDRGKRTHQPSDPMSPATRSHRRRSHQYRSDNQLHDLIDKLLRQG
jgi:hypothetical protein